MTDARNISRSMRLAMQEEAARRNAGRAARYAIAARKIMTVFCAAIVLFTVYVGANIAAADIRSAVSAGRLAAAERGLLAERQAWQSAGNAKMAELTNPWTAAD